MRLAVLLAAMFLIAGCGDDEEPATTEPTVASDPITVGAFIAELRPDKEAILEDIVAGSTACKGVEVDSGFVLLVSAQAIDADQDGPLTDLVEDQC